MLKGYIIEKYNNMGSAYTCARLAEEARVLGHQVDIIGVHDTIINGEHLENHGTILKERDYLINRYKWGHIKDEINKIVTRSYNRLDCYKPYIDKYTQLKSLESNFFIKPKYVLGTVQSSYEDISSELCSTFVSKGLDSSMGREIRLICSADDFSSLSKVYPSEKEILYEEFISSSFGRDLRLFCIRGHAIACMLRESKNDFRANVALGARVTNYPINETLQGIAYDIYSLTNLDVVGIDLLFGDDDYYLCEINVMPGLEGIEQASGINIAHLIIKQIAEDFKD